MGFLVFFGGGRGRMWILKISILSASQSFGENDKRFLITHVTKISTNYPVNNRQY
jgi:hypothetical protein